MAGRGNTNAKRKDETDLQWRSRLAREGQAERDRLEPLVSRETQAHGDYQSATLYEVNDNGAVVRIAAKRNRGGTPICRWIAAGKLNEVQLDTIATCQRLWWVAGGLPRVTANYGERIGGSGNADHAAANAAEAREDLNRLMSYFPGPLKSYFDVFENVCRHSIPAGVAGAGMGYEGKAAEKRAHLVVCFVADIIATHERR